MRREIEAEKVRMTKRRDEELKVAMRLLREAQQAEIDAIAAAEQSTRFLYVKQYEVCVADVARNSTELKAWRAEDLKEVCCREPHTSPIATLPHPTSCEASLRMASAPNPFACSGW